MNIPQEAYDLIRNSEGLALNAYRDPVGILTIGYGHTANVMAGEVITKAQAEQFLQADTQFAINAIAQLVQVTLTPNQAGALMSFIYNLGRQAFFDSTLLRLVNKRDWAGAAKEFGRWTHDQNGNVLPGLVVRRQAEAALFLKGAATVAQGWAHKVVAQAQHNQISCGQTSVAMVIEAHVGGEWDDFRVNAAHGFELLQALQVEDAGAGWRDMGNLTSAVIWDKLIAPKLLADKPIVIGLNGPKFSPSGHGHIVALTALKDGVVTFADPAQGKIRTCTVDDILNCPPHPQGKFFFAPA